MSKRLGMSKRFVMNKRLRTNWLAALGVFGTAWTSGGGTCAAPVVAGATGAAAVAANPKVTALIEGTAHQALFAVAFAGDRGIAVGAAGEILLSNDAGGTWRASKMSGSTTLSLLGVDRRGESEIAVGQGGLILVSQGMDAWQKESADTQERLFAVSMNGNGKAVAVGAFGTVILTNDSGRSWRSIAPPDVATYSDQGAEPHLYAVSVADSGMVTVAGEFGLILRSRDDGAHWTVAHKGEASLFALDLRADGAGFAVGQSGTILRTADGGATWSASASGSEANLLGVSSGADGKAVVTAMNSVLISDDHGSSWRAVAWGDFGSAWYSQVQFVDSPPDTAILVGHAGRILRMSL
jgi:photosystem II stability/assembly factor-like uncharacterized protein